MRHHRAGSETRAGVAAGLERRTPGRRTLTQGLHRRRRADRELRLRPSGTPATAAPRGRAGARLQPTRSDVGEHLVEGMEAANTDHGSTGYEGIWYPGHYRAHCHEEGTPDLWTEDYRHGYADGRFWERVGHMQWRLLPGVSASEGVRRWLAGLTIAECVSTVRALESDAVRRVVGDRKFDARYGSADRETPRDGRLQIGIRTSNVQRDWMKETEANARGEAGSQGDRPVELGDWYYFDNHPKYRLKHPAGLFQGENALYAGRDGRGRQVWSGLGMEKVTEDELYRAMARAYNAPRTDRDERALEAIAERNGGELPEEYREGFFPERIGVEDILSARPYTVHRRRREGGFRVDQGRTLDLDALRAWRNE